MIISLIGFMGCGKSSVGRKLSELLCCPFMDLDDIIEKESGKSIPEIFETEGEEAFRAMEVGMLSATLSQFRTTASQSKVTMVLSLGGGTVMNPECAGLVHENTRCIYLKASVDTLVENLKDESEGRPMLRSSSSLRDRIDELMALRSSTYESTAHIIIDTDGRTINDIAGAIYRDV